MIKIYRAGVIPYIIENNEPLMMFMTPSDSRYGGSNPQIAKGKIEKGESEKEAALREGEEELGLLRDNILTLKRIGRFLGRTDIFIAKIKDKAYFKGTTKETETISWMTFKDFKQLGRQLHIPIIKTAIKQMN